MMKRFNSSARSMLLVTFIVMSSLLMWACFSVKYSTTGATPPGTTFAVPFVENQASNVEPGLSQLVISGLKDYIQENSRLVQINGTADNNFEVIIVGYEPSIPTTIVAGDEASQNKFSITLKVRYTCNVNPDLDFESNFTRSETYSVTAGFESVKAELTDKMIKLLMEDIYKKAFVNW